MRGVSQPPSDPYRPDPYRGQQPHRPPVNRPVSGQAEWNRDGRTPQPPPSHQERLHQERLQREWQRGYGELPAQPRSTVGRDAPPRPSAPRSRGRGALGAGLVLAIVGALVLLVSVTVLPWVSGGGGDLSLAGIWQRVTDGEAAGFGDWYVAILSYPLVFLGVLLSFAAVLESVAMKVIWVALTVLGLGYVALRYGIGPATGLFGEASGFSPFEIALAAVSLVALVVVVFVLKSAVGMFRRIAGLILLGLSGVHIGAVVDLVGANGFTELSAGAYGPALGYLITGAAAFVGPRRLVPGA